MNHVNKYMNAYPKRAVTHYLPFKKCIASNCSLGLLRTLLSATMLAGYFNGHVFSADIVRKPKPAPDLYLYAAYTMSVKPQQCLVIEDSEAGVQAAVSVGMKVWGFWEAVTSHLTLKSSS